MDGENILKGEEEGNKVISVSHSSKTSANLKQRLGFDFKSENQTLTLNISNIKFEDDGTIFSSHILWNQDDKFHRFKGYTNITVLGEYIKRIFL